MLFFLYAVQIFVYNDSISGKGKQTMNTEDNLCKAQHYPNIAKGMKLLCRGFVWDIIAIPVIIVSGRLVLHIALVKIVEMILLLTVCALSSVWSIQGLKLMQIDCKQYQASKEVYVISKVAMLVLILMAFPIRIFVSNKIIVNNLSGLTYICLIVYVGGMFLYMIFLSKQNEKVLQSAQKWRLVRGFSKIRKKFIEIMIVGIVLFEAFVVVVRIVLIVPIFAVFFLPMFFFVCPAFIIYTLYCIGKMFFLLNDASYELA